MSCSSSILPNAAPANRPTAVTESPSKVPPNELPNPAPRAENTTVAISSTFQENKILAQPFAAKTVNMFAQSRHAFGSCGLVSEHRLSGPELPSVLRRFWAICTARLHHLTVH